MKRPQIYPLNIEGWRNLANIIAFVPLVAHEGKWLFVSNMLSQFPYDEYSRDGLLVGPARFELNILAVLLFVGMGSIATLYVFHRAHFAISIVAFVTLGLTSIVWKDSLFLFGRGAQFLPVTCLALAGIWFEWQCHRMERQIRTANMGLNL